MRVELWYVIIGTLLVTVALVGSIVKRLPLTTAMLYLIVSLALGPMGWNLFSIEPLKNAWMLERLSEIAVIASLFTAGLKLRVPLRDPLWKVPVTLGFVSMILTVGLVSALGYFLLGLSPGAAILLGAILAPTDPVLASDVQVEHAQDRDRLRFGLTGEAGLNDGTAFPFVMLGLGMLGLHEIGTWGWRWLLVDVVWAVGAGLSIGFALGAVTAQLVLYLRRQRKEGVGRDEFLVLGLIALAYGSAVFVHAYGFLAVFAAGLALRFVEREHSGERPPEDVVAVGSASEVAEIATHPEKAPAHMAQAVLTFNEQMERILEVALVLIVGGMFTSDLLRPAELWFIPLLILVIRPVAVYVGLIRSDVGPTQRRLMAWFGIRGIGSIYYLMFAIERGISSELASDLIALTLSTIAVSMAVHGISVTPLMKWYEKRALRRRAKKSGVGN